MPKVGEQQNYSNKPGETTFKFSPGAVMKFKESVIRYNRHLGYRCAHTGYIWMRKIGSKRLGYDKKKENYHLSLIYIPLLNGEREKFLVYNHRNQFRSVCRMVWKYGGTEEIGNVRFYKSNPLPWIKLYQLLSLIAPPSNPK